MTTRQAGAAKAKPRPVKETPAETPAPDSVLDDPAVVVVSDDLRELTSGQIEEIEDLIDDSLNVFFDRTYRRGKLHRAIAFVVRKAEDPSFTYEQAANLKLGIRVVTGPVPPTNESD